MQIIIFLIPLFFIIGCSDKNTHLQDKDTQYQRFLHDKADKTLEKELESYDEK